MKKNDTKWLTAVSLLVLAIMVLTGFSADGSASEAIPVKPNDNHVKTLTEFLSKTYPKGEFGSSDSEMKNFKGDFPDLTFKFLNTWRRNKSGYMWRDDSQKCIVINSYTELVDQYIGDVEIPKINFSTFTLILGHVELPYANIYKYESYNIHNEKNETVVTLHFNLKHHNYSGLFDLAGDYYFYEIVPKFTPRKKIKVQADCPTANISRTKEN